MEIEEEISKLGVYNNKTPLSLVDFFKNYEGLSYKVTDKIHSIFSKLFISWHGMFEGVINIKHIKILRYQGGLSKSFEEVIAFLKKKDIVDKVVFLNYRYNDAPEFHAVSIYSRYAPHSTDGPRNGDRPLGHGFEREKSKKLFSKTLGEFLERYFLTLYHKKDLTCSSYQELSASYPAVNPKSFSVFSEEHTRRSNSGALSDQVEFAWERATRISHGKRIYIPAQLIYWTYNLEQEPMLREPNTNGNGGMFTAEGAILAGLYELIERDSFLIFWLNAVAPPQIDPESVSNPEFQKLLQVSRRYGFELFLLNTTLDTGIPSCVAVIGDASGVGPRFVIGGGCHINPARAVYSALVEAWGVYYGLRNKKDTVDSTTILAANYKPFFDHSMGREERLELWANVDMDKKLNFFLDNTKKVEFTKAFELKKFSSEKAELEYAVNKIESLGEGYEVYAYLVNNQVLKSLGYHVAKVVVPALAPLYLVEAHAPLASARLREVLPKLGYKTGHNFNTLPHPFP